MEGGGACIKSIKPSPRQKGIRRSVSLIEHGPICLAAVPRKFIYGHRRRPHGRPSRQDWQRKRRQTSWSSLGIYHPHHLDLDYATSEKDRGTNAGCLYVLLLCFKIRNISSSVNEWSLSALYADAVGQIFLRRTIAPRSPQAGNRGNLNGPLRNLQKRGRANGSRR